VPKKIKKTQPSSNGQSGIRLTQIKPKGVSFSFKFFDDAHDKFCSNDREPYYWKTLLERLKDLSGLTALDMMTNRSSALRCHSIDWTNTSESRFGIPNEQQLVETPYQFSLSSNAHGRVHGFFLDEVFYIVWLDPEHLLYPSK
jgi:hypothetical protein